VTKLNDLLAATRDHATTPAEREEQRRSFAFGNVAIDEPSVTRDDIDRAAETLAACPTCGKRRPIRGRELCQRCERRSVQGPMHQPACTTCHDSGRIDLGGCDIPGCRHWMRCACSPEPAKAPEPHELGGPLDG